MACQTDHCLLAWTIPGHSEVTFGCVDEIGKTLMTGVYTAKLSNDTQGAVLTSMLSFNASQVVNGTIITCSDGFDGSSSTCAIFLIGNKVTSCSDIIIVATHLFAYA